MSRFTSLAHFLLGRAAHLGDDAVVDVSLPDHVGILVGRKRLVARLNWDNRDRSWCGLLGILCLSGLFLICRSLLIGRILGGLLRVVRFSGWRLCDRGHRTE